MKQAFVWLCKMKLWNDGVTITIKNHEGDVRERKEKKAHRLCRSCHGKKILMLISGEKRAALSALRKEWLENLHFKELQIVSLTYIEITIVVMCIIDIDDKYSRLRHKKKTRHSQHGNFVIFFTLIRPFSTKTNIHFAF